MVWFFSFFKQPLGIHSFIQLGFTLFNIRYDFARIQKYMDIIKDFHLKSVWRKQTVKQIMAMKHKKYIQDIIVTQERE